MERVFFIDYENVNTKGLDGIVKLTANDVVYFFYSENHSRMTFGLHRRIGDSPATFYYTKIKDLSKNALDRELISVADEKICDKKADYYIISNDKGYSSFISRKSSKYRVYLLSSIVEANDVKRAWLRQQITERFVDCKGRSYRLSDEDIEKLARMIFDSKDKCDLNEKLQTMFYNQDVKYIFSRLEDLTYNM